MSKNKFFLQVKLVTIGLIFSVFLVGFTCFFRIDKTVDDEDFVSYSNAAEEYYDRLDEVYDEYREEEQDVSKLIITSAFSVMSSHIQDFSYEDMSKRRMRRVADILLDNADEEGEAITFSDEAENKIKEQLADYFKSIDSDLSDITCQSMANDVFNYVEDYLEFTQGVENESTSSTSCDGNSYWWPIGSAETTTENGVTFAIIENETNKIVGNCGIEKIDYINRTGILGIFIGVEEARNKGYGKESVKLLLDFGFNYLNLHSIELKVMSFNKRAIKCYEKCGFKEIGRRREAYFLNGKYHDVIEMDIIRREFKENIIKNKNI